MMYCNAAAQTARTAAVSVFCDTSNGMTSNPGPANYSVARLACSESPSCHEPG